MTIENFSRKIIKSKILNTYIATGFFAMLIFFVLNSNAFTPMDMIIGTIIVTITLKGISNIMFSLIILLFSLQNNQDKYNFKQAEEKLDLLINEIKIKTATTKTNNNENNK